MQNYPLLYYIKDDTTVEFTYNAVSNPLFTGDGNGNYGQLGLDGKQMDEANYTYVQINSAGYYNTQDYNLKSNANYVKITVKLSKKKDYAEPLDIPTYLKDFELLDNRENVITNSDDDTTVITNSSDLIYTYIVPKERLEISDNVYYIPINFKTYSGHNSSLENKSGKDMEYSNYKVLVNVGLLINNSTTETPLQNSDAYDHIIYTNARLHSDVIAP